MTTLKKPVRRVMNIGLDASFGCDRGRRVIVTLRPGNGKDVPDLFELRPERTRRAETIAFLDVYRYAMRCRINRGLLEKVRERKAKKAERLERARIARADKKLSQPMGAI